MKKYLFYMYYMLLCTISFAQIPKSAQELRKEIVQQREMYYPELMLAEHEATPNQEMYDVKYYAIDLIPDTATKTINSTVKIVGEVLATSLDSVELNFRQHFTITDIHLSELPDSQLRYYMYDTILNISLDSTFLQGEQFSIEITYHGSPEGHFYFGDYNSKSLIQVIVKGPYDWWPCKDVLTDRADSLDIRVTVPEEYVVVSSGSLKEVIIEGDTATYWWHEQYPILPVLLGLSIYPYEVHYDDYLYNNGADTMKIHFYTFPGNYDTYRSLYDEVKDMIAFYAECFGEYPFIKEKIGVVDNLYFPTDDIKFGYAGYAQQTLENITIPDFKSKTFAHELSHQWWGCLITGRTVNHVWLVEGFATNSETLWFEYAKYPNKPSTASQYVLTRHPKYYGPGTVYDDIDNTDIVYNKGCWISHMIRGIVGDSIYLDILKTYCASPEFRYGTATIEDFQGICEQVSGINLEKFFHQWFYEEYFPKYEYNWSYQPDNSGYKVTLNVDQVQQEKISESAPIFWMPVDIKITMDNSDTTYIIWDSLITQTFELMVDAEPTKLQFDPDDWILKQVTLITNIEDENIVIPEEFVLDQNYPNPFNYSTSIRFHIPDSYHVTLKVYDINGQVVATLVNEKMNPESHEVTWNAEGIPAGVYFYKLEAGTYIESRKLVLIR